MNPVMLVLSQNNSVYVIGVTLALRYQDTDQTLAYKWLHIALKFLLFPFFLTCFFLYHICLV